MNGHNGAKSQKTALASVGTADQPQPVANDSSGKLVRTEAFDQPVVLQQTPLWSRAIVWGIVGVASFTVIWASVARIEEAVPATGKLEPQGAVQEVQAPVGGVVEEILVEDGMRVEQGDVLVRLDPTSAEAQRQSLEQIRTSLAQETRFYRSQLSGGESLTSAEASQLSLPTEMLALTASRASLISENRLYRAQLNGGSGAGFSLEERDRLESGLAESNSRAEAARFEISQLQEQYDQAQTQLTAAQQTLAINQGIVADLRSLVEEGGIARVQYLRQEQEVLNGQAEVDRLTQEKERLEYAISQARERLENTVAVSRTGLLDKIADNEKRIAEIDSQLNKAIVENEKRIAEIDSQLSQAEVTLRYQELRAPVDGTVFDLQALGPGFVTNTSEPILKIVPADALVAKVFITNQDIGFVREGMDVDVRIDSFPFSEYGDVKGRLIWIGSDALPPTEIRPFYSFPAKIELDRQDLDVNGREVQLQSGMSISANIKVRDRTIMSIFTDLFARKVESLKTTR